MTSGKDGVLVTITGVTGSSTRSPGTHMAVAGDGTYKGSFSGGCVEAAVVGEALRTLNDGNAKSLRFGAGSPFIDIRLPCGGGLDLLFIPRPDIGLLDAVISDLERREAVSLYMTNEGAISLLDYPPRLSGWEGDHFIASHRPDIRVFVIGHGDETMAMARLCDAFGADVVVLTPDRAIAAAIGEAGIAVHWLKIPGRSKDLCADNDSAIIFLFHDHDWEEEIMVQALEQDAFFIGLMGSHATHSRRMQLLRARGVSDQNLDRLVGPVGLIPASRDPDTLAISALAQIIERYKVRNSG